jgi:hypothetical protein
VCCTKNAEVKDEQIHEEKLTNEKTMKIDCNENPVGSKTPVKVAKNVGHSDTGQAVSVESSRVNDQGCEKKKEIKRRLCNGEIFFVKAVS